MHCQLGNRTRSQQPFNRYPDALPAELSPLQKFLALESKWKSAVHDEWSRGRAPAQRCKGYRLPVRYLTSQCVAVVLLKKLICLGCGAFHRLWQHSVQQDLQTDQTRGASRWSVQTDVVFHLSSMND